MTKSTMKNDEPECTYWVNSRGLFHRLDGPAYYNNNGLIEWYRNGRRHRVNGPALIYPDGSEAWYRHDLLHRKVGPAIEHADGTKEWFHRGVRHRVDGPAVVYANSVTSWWFKDKFLGEDSQGFLALWDLLKPKQRKNLNLHLWMSRLQNV